MVAGLEHIRARRRQDRADGNAASERLGDGHDVRRSILVLVGPPAAGAAHPGLDLVEDEQHVALVAQPPDRGEPPRLERNHAALTLDGLEHHRAGRGVDGLLERLEVAVGDVHEPFRQRLELLAVAGIRGCRERTHGATVERALRAHDDVRAVPMHLSPLARQLDGALVCLGTAVAEEHA